MTQNDLISRSALREKFQDECCGECGCCEHNLDAEYVNGIWEYRCALIEDAPSVERPRGRWIPPDFVSDDFWTCSACGVEWFMEDDGGWNFCPNCGADMREDADHGTE